MVLISSAWSNIIIQLIHKNTQLLILASAVCTALAYPGYEPYQHYGSEHSLGGGYQHVAGYADDSHDFGGLQHHQHPVASQRIDGHHEALDHHQHEEHEEHVDYYVSAVPQHTSWNPAIVGRVNGCSLGWNGGGYIIFYYY